MNKQEQDEKIKRAIDMARQRVPIIKKVTESPVVLAYINEFIDHHEQLSDSPIWLPTRLASIHPCFSHAVTTRRIAWDTYAPTVCYTNESVYIEVSLHGLCYHVNSFKEMLKLNKGKFTPSEWYISDDYNGGNGGYVSSKQDVYNLLNNNLHIDPSVLRNFKIDLLSD